jgi:hypothetical protein
MFPCNDIGDWIDLRFWNDSHTVAVDLEWLGEGLSGDYDKDDPEDYPHLRFSVYKKGFNASNAEETEPVEALDDASYCTTVSMFTDVETLALIAKYILDEVSEEVEAGHPIKKICERLSWIDESWVKKPD